MGERSHGSTAPILDADQARVPVTDGGLLYGDAIFEGICVYGGRVLRLDDQLARFAAAARSYATG